MQGKVNDIGVQAREPKTEMNLSREFPSDMQKTTVNATTNVRDKFFNHILFFDFGILLNM